MRGTARALTMDRATELLRARPSLADELAADPPTLTIYDPPGPMDPRGLEGDHIWICDPNTPTGDMDIEILSGGDVTYDRYFRLWVVLQVFRRGDTTWAATNERAEELQGEVLGTFSTNPQLIDPDDTPMAGDPTWDGVECIVANPEVAAGWLPDGTGFGVRFNTPLVCGERLQLT